MTKKIIAVILGGGVGTRLYPLTKDRSKPAVPVAGKYKLIDIPIANCLHADIDRMFVLTQYNSASLNQHLKNTYQFGRFSGGFVDILAAEQTANNKNWFMGTADAVRQVMCHLDEHDYEHVLILSGDQLYQMDLEAMVQQHLEKDADLSIATIPVDAEDAPKFGIMKMETDHRVRSFIEKPAYQKLHNWTSQVEERYRAKGKHYLASMGIYMFKKEALQQSFSDMEEAIDFGKEIIPMSIALGKDVFSYIYDGYWTDIGTVKSYFEANIALSKNRSDKGVRFDLFDQQRRIYSAGLDLPPSYIAGCCIDEALIAEGCMITGKRISKSIIGYNSKIGDHSVIKKSILLGNDQIPQPMQAKSANETSIGIGHHCYLENVIIEKNCRIGNYVEIIGGAHLEDVETERYCIKDGIIILKTGVEIASNTMIGGKPEIEEKERFNIVHLPVSSSLL